MTTILPALPILVPMAAALLSVPLRQNRQRSHLVAMGGALLHLAASLGLMLAVVNQRYVVLWIGGWPAPFGICLVGDYLSAVMVLITAVIHTAVTVYARRDIDARARAPAIIPIMQMLAAAVSGAFLTGDLFNLYVWFEVMLMASFGLLVMGRNKIHLPGSVKYVTINLLSTILFITAIGLIYGLTGTLNMADLHAKAAAVENTALLDALPPCC